MWNLISLIFLSVLFPLSGPKNSVFILVDDCQNWDRSDIWVNKDHFTYQKKSNDWPLIGFTHAWLDEEDSLSTREITYSKILESPHLFTSELSLSQWYELSIDSSPRIFILRPEDYCSRNRFAFGQKFTLYEVKLHVSREE
ncbi:hypothetical protein JYB64_02450 [Algoriphagus aestuarii]|nr:hypothetical protein [Algoriphagus aestuarii]